MVAEEPRHVSARDFGMCRRRALPATELLENDRPPFGDSAGKVRHRVVQPARKDHRDEGNGLFPKKGTGAGHCAPQRCQARAVIRSGRNVVCRQAAAAQSRLPHTLGRTFPSDGASDRQLLIRKPWNKHSNPN